MGGKLTCNCIIINENPFHELILKYEIDNPDKNVKIFGTEFVKNNSENCKILHKNKIYKLSDSFTDKSSEPNIDILEIKLFQINSLTDISYMFHECTSLISITNFDKWETNEIKDMSFLFTNCKSLKKLPDISKWDISNVTNISEMFYGCEKLKELPDISKWNTNKIEKMNH